MSFLWQKIKALYAKFRAMVVRLFSLKDTPHSVAGGVAIGIFMGFSPFFGFKTLLSLGSAYALRCNAIAAVIAVSLHDVAAPLVPLLLRLEYQIGYWILSSPHQLPPPLELHHKKLAQYLKWGPSDWSIWFHEVFRWDNFVDVFLPLFLGSIIVAIPIAVAMYFLMLYILLARERRRARQEPPQP